MRTLREWVTELRPFAEALSELGRRCRHIEILYERADGRIANLEEFLGPLDAANAREFARLVGSPGDGAVTSDDVERALRAIGELARFSEAGLDCGIPPLDVPARVWTGNVFDAAIFDEGERPWREPGREPTRRFYVREGVRLDADGSIIRTPAR